MDKLPSNADSGRSQVSNTHTVTNRPQGSRRNKVAKLLGALLVVAALVAGALYFYKQNMQVVIDKNAYQAVFLTNGQVYFGKLQLGNGEYLKLTNIYYLQAQDAQAAGKEAKDNAVSPQNGTDANTQLIKLGKELHSPKDVMTISKDHVLFWEDIEDGGKVAQAIKDYETKK
jgi:uncharacterized protein HemX